MITKQEETTTYTPFTSVQNIRLIDVFVVAPFCFYVATYKTLPMWVRGGLILLGGTTLIFNGNNYLKNLKK
jgi:hypothetical protein